MAIFRPELKSVYQERRKKLVELVLGKHKKDGLVILFGNFEHDASPYKQDASFFYFTGIVDPASALTVDTATLKTTLYVPNTGGVRAAWVADVIEPGKEQAEKIGVEEIAYLGEQCAGYQCHPFFSANEYAHVIKVVEEAHQAGKILYSINPSTAAGVLEQRFIIQRLISLKPALLNAFVDIMPEVARLRRKKSKKEIEQLYKAIKITQTAQEAAAQMIAPGKYEFEVQAALEYVFTSEGAGIAFPSIVGSGVNSTILHYADNTKALDKNEVVVVDIGAQYNYYCADITRTYPVSGEFTARQKEIYNLVLETQEYIAQLAKPGIWLSNKEKPEQSLNHLARKFLQEKGYDKYFMHGIGHFLGIDVHDVGDYNDPLEPGDVITIEPGIYIRSEGIGVRIEDNYWIVDGGAICLSEDIPKSLDEVEAMAKNSFAQPEAAELDESEDLDD